MKASADVVIVGGGIVGASIAYEVARRGAGRVRLFEERHFGAGGTGRSTGVLRQFYLLRELVEMAREGTDWYRNFASHVEGGEAGFVQCGLAVVGLASQRDAFGKAVEVQRPFDTGSEILEAAQVKARWPEVEVDDIDCCYFEPEAGYADPGRACNATVGAARQYGVNVYQSTPVTGIQLDGHGVAGVSTRSGDIATRVVVNAAGLWARQVGRLASVELPIETSRHQVICIEKPERISRSYPIISDSVGLVYIRPDGDLQVLIGSTDPRDSAELVDPDSAPTRADPDRVEGLWHHAVDRVPCLGEGGLVTDWSGTYDSTPDGFPLLGETPGVPGFVQACGLSGHGFKLAPAIARLVATSIVEGKVERPMNMLRPSRFAEGEGLLAPTTTALTSMRGIGESSGALRPAG